MEHSAEEPLDAEQGTMSSCPQKTPVGREKGHTAVWSPAHATLLPASQTGRARSADADGELPPQPELLQLPQNTGEGAGAGARKPAAERRQGQQWPLPGSTQGKQPMANMTQGQGGEGKLHLFNALRA